MDSPARAGVSRRSTLLREPYKHEESEPSTDPYEYRFTCIFGSTS